MAGDDDPRAESKAHAAGQASVAIGGENHGDITTNAWSTGSEEPSEAIFDLGALERDLGLDLYTGREWLIDKLDAFMSRERSGYFFVEGDAGVGKTAFAAYLAKHRGLIYHFADIPGGESPSAARKSLMAQLILRFDLTEALGDDGRLRSSAGSRAALNDVLSAVSERLSAEGDASLLLAIDAPDQAEPEGTPDELTPLGLPNALPSGIFALVTARVGLDSSGVREPTEFCRIDTVDERNIADMREFLLARGSIPNAGGRAEVDLHQRLISRCSGNWMHLRYLLAEIEAGTRDPSELAGLPESLAQYYLFQLRAWRMQEKKWSQLILPLLGVMAALRQPAPGSFLAELLPTEPSKVDLQEVLDGLLRPFLHRADFAGDATYGIRHESFRELLVGEGARGRNEHEQRTVELLASETKEAHERFAARLVPAADENGRRRWDVVDGEFASRYRARYLADHAAVAGCLENLIGDAQFLLGIEPAGLLRQEPSTDAGKRGMSAFRLALNSFEGEEMVDRAWLLHAAAARAGAAELAAEAFEISDVPWCVSRVWGTRASHLSFTFPLLPDRPNSWIHGLAALGGVDGVAVVRRDSTLRYLSGRWGTPPKNLGDVPGCALDAVRLSMGDVFVIGCADGQVILVPLAGGKVVHLESHEDKVVEVTAAQVGDYDVVVSGGMDGRLIVQMPTGDSTRIISDHDDWVTALVLTPLDTSSFALLWAGTDGTVRSSAFAIEEDGTLSEPVTAVSWEMPQLSETLESGDPIPENPYDYVISYGESGGEMKVVDPPPTHDRSVFSLARLPSREGCVFVGGARGSLSLVDLANREVLVDYEGHDGAVTDICLAAIGGEDILVSASVDGTIRLWAIQSGECLGVLREHSGQVSQVAWSQVEGQRVLFAGGSDGTVSAWYLEDLAAEVPSSWPAVRAISLGSWDGEEVLFAGCGDSTIRILSRTTGGEQAQLEGHAGRVTSLAAARLDGAEVLVSGDSTGQVMLWRPHQTPRSLGDASDAEAGGVLAVSIGTLDGAPTVGVARGSEASSARTFQALGLDEYTTMDWTGSAGRGAEAVLGDSLFVCSDFSSPEAKLWEPPGVELISRQTGHEERLTAVGFIGAAEERRIVSCDASGAVRESSPTHARTAQLCEAGDALRGFAVMPGSGGELLFALRGAEKLHVRSKVMSPISLPAHRFTSDVVIAPGGACIFTTGSGPSIIEWRYEQEPASP